mmetsp:Transcript_101934/g.181084  ORF Transcript_101934/g.181084 Transcript_101934/m.181084 type:complete len:303 (-) Transcript_101934:192-1100(-)
MEVTWVKPVLFEFLGLKLYAYGAFVASALGACVLVAEMEVRRLKIPADAACLMIAFIPGFGIGSKLHLVVSALAAGQPIPNLGLESGHSFMGSAVGGMMSASAYGYYVGLRPLPLLDLIAPLVPLGHSIGKLGCFFSGDGCYGPDAPKDSMFAMSFPNALVPTRKFVYPTPLLEFVLSGTLFLFMHFCYGLPSFSSGWSRRVGARSAVTLGLYGIERMCIEPYRRHPPSDYMLGLTEYQFLAVVFILLGLLFASIGKSMTPWPLKLGEENNEDSVEETAKKTEERENKTEETATKKEKKKTK